MSILKFSSILEHSKTIKVIVKSWKMNQFLASTKNITFKNSIQKCVYNSDEDNYFISFKMLSVLTTCGCLFLRRFGKVAEI